MKVALINKWDTGGGAARAAYRLALGLRAEGVNVTYHVHYKTSDHEWVVIRARSNQGLKHENRLQAYFDSNRTACSNTYFTQSDAMLESRDLEAIGAADVINLHWVEKFFSTATIAKLLAFGKPIVWTLHDERPLTGGCHYTAGCEQYAVAGCSRCMQIRDGGQGIPMSNLRDKLKLLTGANITIVTPSRWLGDRAKRSKVFRDHRVAVIPNSLDTSVFRPINKLIARDALGLPRDRFIILFGAQDAGERRKGYVELLQAMQRFLVDPRVKDSQDRKPLVLTFGDGVGTTWPLSVERHCLGAINKDSRLAEMYSAADIFAMPSLEDNLPNTILEAMACGTPCVGFPVGGIPDLVRPRETGFLAPMVSARAFAHVLSQAYGDSSRLEAMSIRCADFVRSELNQAAQARRYQQLFDELLKSRDQVLPQRRFSRVT